MSAYITDTSSSANRDSILDNSQELIKYLQQPLHPSVTSITKRLIDIIGAVIGLIITAFVMIPVAIANLSYDRGPIFYTQTRCGLHGETFQIWKFRSMVVNADKLKHLVKNEAQGHMFKCANDPRVTPIGRLLRRSSLDELPQFWNVLRGEMSLVGTRPPTVDEVQKYQQHHWVRLQVKPGMTGEWQANGRSSIKDFEQVVQMDIDYQNKWSPMYDLKLIAKTIWVVIKASGAY
ncbi:MAG: sugar transferase [Calothrix sp. C42_A2020_038]|nr:sugar transferase [Calothrix sp. C42_A2020_038]